MNQLQRFTGKTLVVTGGGGDIGNAVAQRLGEEGASVALINRNEDKLNAAVKVLREKGINTEGYLCDVMDIDTLSTTKDKILSRFGSIDLLFNNAGSQGSFSPIHEYPTDIFANTINVNVIGVFNVLKIMSAPMIEQQQGVIVNTASMAGIMGNPNMAAYAASKAAVIGLTKTAAKDLAPYHIRVNSISPGLIGPGGMWDKQVNAQADVESQYFSDNPDEVAQQMLSGVPMRRYGSVQEVAGSVAYLMSDDASYVNGINLPISGGRN